MEKNLRYYGQNYGTIPNTRGNFDLRRKKTCQITKNKETDNGKNYGIYNFRTLIYYEKKL